MKRLLIALALVAATLSCNYISPAAPSRIGWYLQGFGSAVIDVPADVRTVQIDLTIVSGIDCGPLRVSDVRGVRHNETVCPGDKRTIDLGLTFGNTIELVAPAAARWVISETGSRL